jgi:hypothetical protein
VADRCDPVPLDQDVAAEEVAEGAIHCQHLATTKQRALGHEPASSTSFVQWN